LKWFLSHYSLHCHQICLCIPR